ELDAAELQREQLSDAGDHERLGDAGHTLEDAVALTEQGDHHLLEHLVLANDDARQLLGHLLIAAGELLGGAKVGLVHRLGPRGGLHGGSHGKVRADSGTGLRLSSATVVSMRWNFQRPIDTLPNWSYLIDLTALPPTAHACAPPNLAVLSRRQPP